MQVVALIPAAGQGKRMGAEKPKAFLPLGPISILAHTLQKFEACPRVDEILPLVPPGEGVIWAEEIVRPVRPEEGFPDLAGRTGTAGIGFHRAAGRPGKSRLGHHP